MKKNKIKTIELYLAAQTESQRSIILKLSSFNSFEDLVYSLDLSEKIELAENSIITEKILEVLSNDTDESVKNSVFIRFIMNVFD